MADTATASARREKPALSVLTVSCFKKGNFKLLHDVEWSCVGVELHSLPEAWYYLVVAVVNFVVFVVVVVVVVFPQLKMVVSTLERQLTAKGKELNAFRLKHNIRFQDDGAQGGKGQESAASAPAQQGVLIS